VSLAFRAALPAAMLAVLIYTLNVAGRELRQWNAQVETPHRMVVPNNYSESVTFTLYPLQHSARIQDAIGLQWPAFLVAGIITPVPRLSYSERGPNTLTWASYVTLPLAVGLYWFVIGAWIDKRFIQRKRPVHSRVVRFMIATSLALTTLFLLLFLGKDLVQGWPEGPQGAYGFTAWLAIVAAILLTEIRGLRQGEPQAQ
jgi:hypothetical protein